MRRSRASCSPFRLMYCHSFLVSSVRGIGVEPTTAESAASGCTGRMNAALGFRLDLAFFALRAAGLRAAFLVLFFLAFFFLAAIVFSLVKWPQLRFFPLYEPYFVSPKYN